MRGSDSLVGTWALVAARSTSDNSVDEAPFGESPRGVLVYTADSRVVALISYSGRDHLSGDRISAPAHERAEAFASFFAYAGRYDVQDGRVVHHVEIASVENWVGTDLVRVLQLDGPTLRLRTPPVSVGGQTRVTELDWTRLED